MAEKKSNTVYLELPATFEWAKVFPENKDTTGANNELVGTGGAYSVDAIFTKDVFQQLEDAGSQKTPQIKNKDGKWLSEKKWKTKEQGISYLDALEEATELKVKLVRKHDAPYTYGGPPQVAHVDGTPWDINDDGLIGNGTKGILYVSVYEAGGLKGTRLDGVQVIEHVAYESDREDDGPRGFKIPNRAATKEEAKPQVKSKAKQATREMIEDEIPFD
jgi:hypothetical protein